MPLTSDEIALRSALQDVTVGQPELPVDRMAGVRRRHAHRRAMQSAGAALAAVVVVAGALVARTDLRGGHVSPANRDVPSWALPWADHRDGSVPENVLAGAVKIWASKQRLDNSLPPSVPIAMPPAVWYVGQRIPGTDEVLAVFEASGLHAGALPLTNGNRLVVATKTRDDGWTFNDVAAPPRDYTGVVGGYSAVVADPQGEARNVVWLLTSPRYRNAVVDGSYGQGGSTTSGVDRAGSVALQRGFATFDAGYLRSELRITLQSVSGETVQAGPVGVPGSAGSHRPTLEKARALSHLPTSGQSFGEGWGQGSGLYADMDVHGSGRTTIYARCYGGARIHVAIDREPSPRTGAVIPCDNRQHVVPGGPLVNGFVQGGHAYGVRASNVTAWTVAVFAP
jgi:hypothetical protein